MRKRERSKGSGKECFGGETRGFVKGKGDDSSNCWVGDQGGGKRGGERGERKSKWTGGGIQERLHDGHHFKNAILDIRY